MQHSKTTIKPKEQSSIQSSTDTNDKENYPLLTREQIEKTPFWIVGSEEIGYKITWGKYTFNDEPLKKENVKTWWDDNQWQIILHVIAIGIQASKDEKPK